MFLPDEVDIHISAKVPKKNVSMLLMLVLKFEILLFLPFINFMGKMLSAKLLKVSFDSLSNCSQSSFLVRIQMHSSLQT